MNEQEIFTWIRSHGELGYSRSSGPGGQNVNKVSSKVTLRVPLLSLPLTSEEHTQVRSRLHNRLTKEGELIIHSSETRSQKQNRSLAEQRALVLILGALEKPKKRHISRPGKAARERRLAQKKRRAETKRLRGNPLP